MPRSSFDPLRTSARLRLCQAAAGDVGVLGDGLDEHPASAVLLRREGQCSRPAEGIYEGFRPNSAK
jgi:hypothetical protein